MEPFALLKMMGIFVTGGITGRIVLYLLLLAAGIGVRCALQRRRDFWTAAGISAGLWLVCEIIVDIGSVHEMSRSAWGLPRLSAGCCAGSSLCDPMASAPAGSFPRGRFQFSAAPSAQPLHERVPQLQ